MGGQKNKKRSTRRTRGDLLAFLGVGAVAHTGGSTDLPEFQSDTVGYPELDLPDGLNPDRLNAGGSGNLDDDDFMESSRYGCCSTDENPTLEPDLDWDLNEPQPKNCYCPCRANPTEYPDDEYNPYYQHGNVNQVDQIGGLMWYWWVTIFSVVTGGLICLNSVTCCMY